MMGQTSLFLLLLLVVGSCHGNPTGKKRASRVQERAGGLMELGDIPVQVRSVCSTVLNVESVLTTFPLSLMSGVVFSIPLPIPNPLILDPLRLFELGQSVMTSFQNIVNGVSAVTPTSRKRDLGSFTGSSEIDRLNREIGNLREKLDQAFKPFNLQRRSLTEREAEDPGKPGYLLNLRNILDIFKQVCPWNDLVDSFYHSSFLKFLNLNRIPLPIPNGEQINVLKALDIWNIQGGIQNAIDSISRLFSGEAPTTPAPSGGFLSGIFGGGTVVTTAAPNLFQQAISSVGSLFGLFGGSSAASPPQSAASMVQNDDEMVVELPEPVVMVATVPLAATTAAPVKLTGSILGVNMDWLFGNDSAKPIVAAPTASASPATTTLSPIASFFDSLFGSDTAVVPSPIKPSSPSPRVNTTTTKASTGARPTTTMASRATTKASNAAAKTTAVPTTTTAAKTTTIPRTTTTKSSRGLNLLGWQLW